MSDLLLGLVVVFLTATAAIAGTVRLSRSISRPARSFLAAAIVLAIGSYTLFLWDKTILSDMLPVPALIIVGNWFPVGAAALAGVVLESRIGGSLRRRFYAVALITVSVYAVIIPVIGDPPDCATERTRDGFCTQTTPSTCSAACAVNLLKLHRIRATEQEMAQLCLTRDGTRWLGLYRGLKLKTRNTPWDVDVFDCSATDMSTLSCSPFIASVGLEPDFAAGSDFENDSGWRPGAGHSVLVLGFTHNGAADVVDPEPEYGHEIWPQRQWKQLWQGRGFRLVPRH